MTPVWWFQRWHLIFFQTHIPGREEIYRNPDMLDYYVPSDYSNLSVTDYLIGKNGNGCEIRQYLHLYLQSEINLLENWTLNVNIY